MNSTVSVSDVTSIGSRVVQCCVSDYQVCVIDERVLLTLTSGSRQITSNPDTAEGRQVLPLF